MRADNRHYRSRVSHSELAQFILRHRGRVADDPTLSSAKRNIDDGALPCHESSKTRYLSRVTCGW